MAKKWGAGHVAAMGRMGLHELQAAVYPDSNVAQRAEVGAVGSPTQGEVASARKEDQAQSEPQQESVVDRYVREAETRNDPEPSQEQDHDH